MGTMSANTFRLLVAAVWVAGIAGMIVSSANGNNNGWVITCGLSTAVASILLLSVSAVTNRERLDVFDEADAERLEHRIELVVRSGADENEVRSLVRDSMRLGRRR
jgi:hypothetical protein